MSVLQNKTVSWRYGVARWACKLVIAAGVAFFPTTSHADDIAVAALGDSLTQGYGLLEINGFVPQLTRWLKSHGRDVLVINAGVSGDTTAGGLSRVDWTLDSRVGAMIVALGGNDILRGIAPDVARANLEGILQAAAQKDVKVLLVGLEAPTNYGPDYKSQFDAIYPQLALEYGAQLYPSFLQALADMDRQQALADFMQPDGIHPNAAGVARIVEDIGPAVVDLIDSAR